MAHSEGPWAARGNQIFSGDRLVCSVPSYVATGHNEDNVRLIAQALEMYETLKDLVCTCGYGIGHPGFSKHSDSCQRALNVVAKVENTFEENDDA